jgi:hypothetical protein
MSDKKLLPDAATAESDEPASTPKKGKKAAAAKGKGGKGKVRGISIAGHPRARAQVRRAKGWGGLAGFGIAAYLSFQAGVPFPLVVVRAIAAGTVLYMVAWACSLTVWRHLVLAELRALNERHEAARASAGSAPVIADKKPTSKPGR